MTTYVVRGSVVGMALLAASVVVGVAGERDARAGVVLEQDHIDATRAVFKSASVVVPQSFKLKGMNLAKGAYVIEFSPEQKGAAHQAMASDTVVVKFFADEKGALKLKGATTAVLTVVRPAEEGKGMKKASLKDFGFNDGHTVLVSPDGAVLRFKAIGAKGASIDFSVEAAAS